MGQKNSKGAVSITEDSKRIRLRWRHEGKRYSINVAAFSQINLLKAKKIALQIEQDMILDQFDQSLERYHQKPKTQKNTRVQQPMAVEFASWATSYKQIDLNQNVHYRSVWKLLQRWKIQDAVEIVGKLNNLKIAPKTYNERLRMLRDFMRWGVKQKLFGCNPLEDVAYRKIKKTEKPKRQPFTLDEIQAILSALKDNTFSPPTSHYPHSHYYPFLYFLFATGVRNGEAVGLQVRHIDFSRKMVQIQDSLSRTVSGTHAGARGRKETKNGKTRQIPLTDELMQILIAQTTGKKEEDLVFPSFTGRAIDDRMFQRRVFKPVLAQLGIAERDLYACRHTFGSRCIEAGITPVMTAFLMGNNPETALRNYTHQISLPKELPKL